MDSRFPGMDPYLESADIWPDFQRALAVCVREALQPALPAEYYAMLQVRAEPLRTSFVEIREVAPGGRLVTLIEILSPSNKRPGPDRDAFTQKQKEIFQSDANWVEVDLLRAGHRHGGHPRVHTYCQTKGYDYVVVVNRSERRHPQLDLEIYGFTVRDPFPEVKIPLRAPDADVPLALEQVFARAYDTGPYRKIVDYGKPLDVQER